LGGGGAQLSVSVSGPFEIEDYINHVKCTHAHANAPSSNDGGHSGRGFAAAVAVAAAAAAAEAAISVEGRAAAPVGGFSGIRGVVVEAGGAPMRAAKESVAKATRTGRPSTCRPWYVLGVGVGFGIGGDVW
jgi:hypothetical protein